MMDIHTRERILKLIALAKGSSNPNERESAKKRAEELMRQNNISKQDLESSHKAMVFDELTKVIIAYTKNHPLKTDGIFGSFDIIGEIIIQSKKHLTDNNKSSIINTLNKNLKILSILIGSEHNQLLSLIESTLKNHGIQGTK